MLMCEARFCGVRMTRDRFRRWGAVVLAGSLLGGVISGCGGGTASGTAAETSGCGPLDISANDTVSQAPSGPVGPDAAVAMVITVLFGAITPALTPLMLYVFTDARTDLFVPARVAFGPIATAVDTVGGLHAERPCPQD